MRTNEAIQAIMDKMGVKRAMMAKRLGSSRGTVGNQLDGRNELSVKKVLEYIDELGYEMLLVPKGTNIKEGQYLIDETIAKNDPTQSPATAELEAHLGL